MIIKQKVHKINARAPKIPGGNYLTGRIGFWALVTDVNSINNTVTVISDTGFELPNIPVCSNEWVTVDDNKNYIPSERNLPPKNSRVFVLTPTYTATGAFVLCSGFSRGDENIRTLWAKNKSELEEKNNSREVKTQGGWDITEEYSNGNYSAKSNDEKITITVNTTQDDNKGQKKEVSISAWNNSIVINEDGITITDKNNNSIKMTSSDINIVANNSSKLKIGNASASIFSVLNSLLTTLNSGTVLTQGSPAVHTITANQFTSSVTELNKVLKG